MVKKQKAYMPNKGKSLEWETPPALFKLLDHYYGPIDLDVFASQDNAKCVRFFTNKRKLDPDKPQPEAVNGLKQDWKAKVAFMNPPYPSKALYVAFQKAWLEVLKGNCKKVVALVPNKTDSRWFHSFVFLKARIIPLKGRLQYGNTSDKVVKESATFGSLVIIITSPTYNYSLEVEDLAFIKASANL